MSHPQFSEDISKIFVRCTYINFHIIACLRAKQALDTSQVGQLSGESSLIKRSQIVFEWLQNNQSFRDIFLLIMEENEQEHVSNLLKGIRNGCHMPLSQSRYTRLESVAPTLMLIIINDEGLIAKLRTKRAISEIDRQDITQAIEDYKRNWNLIEAILRRSDYAFDCFEEALRETNQVHVANYLHEGKVIAVHAKTTQPEKDAVLSDSINKTILDESKVDPSSEEKLLTPINGYNIHPVAATPGQSIVFFIYCKTVDNVITFTKLFISGDLQSMLEVIMNRLLLKIDPGNTEKIKARLSLDYEEILAVEKYSGIADWMPVELKETTRVPNIICSTEPQTESQYEDDSCDNDWASAKIERVSSWSIPSSIGTCIRGDDSGRPIYDSDYRFLSGDLQSSLTVTERLSFSAAVVEESGHKDWIPAEVEEATSQSIILNSVGTQTECRNEENKSLLFGELPVQYESDPTLIGTIRIENLRPGKDFINGMTILDKELFITSERGTEVVVYDSMTFSFNRIWDFMELNCLKDIVSCSLNKCLYVVGWENRPENIEIWRVNSNGKLINKWSTDTNYGCSLSVTNESNVIFVGRNTKGLSEYSPDGQLIREIKLSYEFGCLWHAIKLANGQFVISDGCPSCATQRVSIVDEHGGMRKSIYFPTIRKYIYDDPIYLSVDGNGFVVVGDGRGRRVLLLDSDLEFKRNILSYRFHYPRRILLDESNGRLIVADSDSWKVHEILIFQLNKIR